MTALARKHPGNPELADILRLSGDQLRKEIPLHPVQHKALSDLTRCRTPQMGGHLRQHQWADGLQARLLPTPYFHLVFTLPHKLNSLVYLNQQLLYDLLFRSAWKALQQAALNPRFLGAQPGAMAMLHTWGATLNYHPHLHLLVPAGGLSEDGMEWIRSPVSFFVPRKALAGMFRGIFVRGLARLWADSRMRIPEGTPPFDTLKRQLYDKPWNVHLEKVRGGVAGVVAYLSRYTHRVAISNHRILKMGDGQVCFAYKDHRDGQHKRMSLDIKEFSLHADPLLRAYGPGVFPHLAAGRCPDRPLPALAEAGGPVHPGGAA